ncbi:hypothetical protein SAMN02910447_03067 [Ruminococcus sp. YE71]|nr:hypothetical protein SAMN02910446_03139 [Ruminococcus sp. YE78]SFW48442.1 hypothetical protein SAMN02910447_03067 [Ruminococcus sp. YE71]
MMDMKLYGQADFLYAVSRQILERLFSSGIISEEQKVRADELNRKTIFERYSSIADLEVSA